MGFNHIANAFNGIEKRMNAKRKYKFNSIGWFTYLDCQVSIICHKTGRQHLSVEVGAY